MITEIIGGYGVALLGNWALRSTKANTEALSLSIVLYMEFDPEVKNREVDDDLHPLREATRAAAQSGAGHAR
jgi:hypothetical protein